MKAFIDHPLQNFEYFINTPQTITLSGWAFFEYEPVSYIQIMMDDDLLFISEPNILHKPTVIKVFPEAASFNKPIGFRFYLKLPNDTTPGIHKLYVYGLNSKGAREMIGEINFNAVLLPQKTTFSQLFKIIPDHLLVKVSGNTSEDDFISTGETGAEIILKNIKKSNCNKILDFGCGLCRILKPMKLKLPGSDIIGFDIDPLMLSWAAYLHGKDFCTLVSSTLDFPENTFDLIYAGSVFTHIDNTRDYWFSEIHRLLKPDGKAFITYQDDTFFHQLADDPEFIDITTDDKLEKYIVFGKENAEGGSDKGTFYETKHWNGILEYFFNIECTVVQGIFQQSFSVVTKKDSHINKTAAEKKYIREIEKQLYRLKQKKTDKPWPTH